MIHLNIPVFAQWFVLVWQANTSSDPIAQWDSENISLAYGEGTKAGRQYPPLCFALLLGAPKLPQLLKSEMVQMFAGKILLASGNS